MESLYQLWKGVNGPGRDEELRDQTYIAAEGIWYNIRRRERQHLYRRLADFEDTEEDEEEEEDEEDADAKGSDAETNDKIQDDGVDKGEEAPPVAISPTAEKEADPPVVPAEAVTVAGTRELPFSVEDECN